MVTGSLVGDRSRQARRDAQIHTVVARASWELCDAASYAALLSGWRTAANLLAMISRRAMTAVDGTACAGVAGPERAARLALMDWNWRRGAVRPAPRTSRGIRAGPARTGVRRASESVVRRSQNSWRWRDGRSTA
ncbi:hypothetical protein HBB16_06300 [Pseudonocardia sp. MCCB 268]|nr:hypothetical protein [Pseudonocardia cytotoxica]